MPIWRQTTIFQATSGVKLTPIARQKAHNEVKQTGNQRAYLAKSTYGEIARQAGMPGAARRVGKALRDLPNDTRVPWFRVVNAQGRLSFPESSPSRAFARAQLESEGVTFSAANRLNLKQHGWP